MTNQKIDLLSPAKTIVETFVNLVLDKIQVNDLIFPANVKFYYHEDQSELHYNDTVEIVDIDVSGMEYFEKIPDIEIEIEIVKNESKSFYDANYFFDLENSHDSGEIIITIFASSNHKQFVLELEENKRFLIGAMVHEMYHSVQRVLQGKKLKVPLEVDLKTHSNLEDETEARVEEICALLEGYPLTLNLFSQELVRYIERYIIRNSQNTSLADIRVIKKKMYESHVRGFKNKFLKKTKKS